MLDTINAIVMQFGWKYTMIYSTNAFFKSINMTALTLLLSMFTYQSLVDLSNHVTTECRVRKPD